MAGLSKYLILLAILCTLLFGYWVFKRENSSFILNPFPPSFLSQVPVERKQLTASIPTVLYPGMGDSCFNPGFSQLTKMVEERTGQPAYCIGPGFDPTSDMINGFAKTMLEQVKHFEVKIRKIPSLKHGFNAIGLSQGNLILRAYAQSVKDIPIVNFISIHGPHAGVSAIPKCDPSFGLLSTLCKLLDVLIGTQVYSTDIQTSLAQANYFRDPFKLDEYSKKCLFLPEYLDLTKTTLTSLNRFVLIMAEKDTMIFPKESEYFGAFESNSLTRVIPGNLQPWYESLGLKTLEETGRLITLKTSGNHLEFSRTELYNWIDTYFNTLANI
jgi:palmitoyl-protein thioesterase